MFPIPIDPDLQNAMREATSILSEAHRNRNEQTSGAIGYILVACDFDNGSVYHLTNMQLDSMFVTLEQYLKRNGRLKPYPEMTQSNN